LLKVVFLLYAGSFEDLKAGLANLRRKALQQNEGPFAHAKINLTTFLDCYEMLTGKFKHFK